MPKPAKPPLTMVRSDNEIVTLYIYSDTAGTVPVNITGRTYVMSIAPTPGATVTTSATGSVTGASGLVQFTFPTAKTVLLTGTSYWYDIVETVSAVESTICLGPITVVTGVTA